MAQEMRLDKFMSLAGVLSRSDTVRAIRAGDVLVDGVPPRRADEKIDADSAVITYRGERVVYREFTYVILNKPKGYVSATEACPPTAFPLRTLGQKYYGAYDTNQRRASVS